MSKAYLLVICLLLTSFTGCTDQEETETTEESEPEKEIDNTEQTPIEGCTTSTANNYNQNATVDDGSCTFDPPPLTDCVTLNLSIIDTPEIFDALTVHFPKAISVFGIHLLATSGVDDDALLHAAAVMAGYLDDDSDGIANDPAVVQAMVDANAAMVIPQTEYELESIIEDLPESFHVKMDEGVFALQDLYEDEIHPGGRTANGFDATLEEVLHLITHVGYATVYPDDFAETPGTTLTNAMDEARGGHYEEDDIDDCEEEEGPCALPPGGYSESSWYHYDDGTCDYSCMATEYLYWALTTHLGAQSDSGRCYWISEEWEPCTREQLAQMDPAIVSLIESSTLASSLPSGEYCPDDSINNDIKGCMDVNATNYNQNATVDDGSCTFDPPEPDPIEGCTNSTANNYNQNATVDDGSCTFDPPEPVVIVWSDNTVHAISANKTANIQLIENDVEFTIVSIEPVLPDGLTFDTNGNLTGTPTTRSTWNTYEITVNTISHNFTNNITLAVHDLDADWHDITADVGTVDYGGSYVSLILPLGEWAFPIGIDSSDRPLFSAAHSGFGRIVGYGHEGLVTHGGGGNETQLSLNAIEWVCGGTDKSVALESSFNHFEDELEAEGYAVTTSATTDDLNNVDCFVTEFWNNYDDTENDIIENFLSSGGGLVMGGHAWYWAYSNEDVANNYPGNKIFRTTGLFVSSSGGGANLDLGNEAPSPLYRTLTAVDAVEKHMADVVTLSDSEQSIASTTISLAVNQLPIDFDIIWIPLRELSDDVGWLEINSDNIFDLGADPIDDLLLNIQQNLLTRLPADELIAHPSSSDFPGAVPDSAPRVTRTISIDGDYEGLPSSFGYAGARADGRMTTGLYAAPGDVVTVTFPEDIVDTGVNVLIGAHTDSLWNKDTISRHPIIYRVWSVSNETIEIGNAWGGPIYIRIPAGSTLGTFDVTIEQAVEAPHYVHGVTDISDWQDTIRYLPAPWAEIESEQFILSVPSSEIRELDDPDHTMNFWDEALQMEHNLSGFTPWPRVERAVFDIQISAGWMHSGYPFMAHLASVSDVVNGTQMYENGDWGMFHELGHNHQWMPSTLPGTTETTCNLYSVKLMTELVGVELAEGHGALSSDSRESRTEDYFDGGSDINQWSVWVALETYLQIQEYFGWDPITEALTAYYDMEDPPGDSDAEFNRWVLELSEATNHNLAPFHEAWGFPLTQETKDALLHLPVWVDDPLRGWVYEYDPIFHNLSAENVTSSSADLEWNVYDNGTNTMISVCWGVTDGGDDRDLWYSCEDIGSSYVGHWSYGVDDLASETTYYFRVVGENNNGDTWSDVASFTTS